MNLTDLENDLRSYYRQKADELRSGAAGSTHHAPPLSATLGRRWTRVAFGVAAALAVLSPALVSVGHESPTIRTGETAATPPTTLHSAPRPDVGPRLHRFLGAYMRTTKTFDLIQGVEVEGTALTVHVGSNYPGATPSEPSDCDIRFFAGVTESADEVRVWLDISEPVRSRECGLALHFEERPIMVRLGRPLAGRALLVAGVELRASGSQLTAATVPDDWDLLVEGPTNYVGWPYPDDLYTGSWTRFWGPPIDHLDEEGVRYSHAAVCTTDVYSERSTPVGPVVGIRLTEGPVAVADVYTSWLCAGDPLVKVIEINGVRAVLHESQRQAYQQLWWETDTSAYTLEAINVDVDTMLEFARGLVEPPVNAAG